MHSRALRSLGWNWVIASMGFSSGGARRNRQVGEKGARELGGQVVVGPREYAGAKLAEQDRVLEHSEYHRQREAGRALRVVMPDLGAVREQERREAGGDVLGESLAPRVELRVDPHALRECAQESALLAMDLDQEAHDGS